MSENLNGLFGPSPDEKFYVFCPRKSDGAKDLVEALGASRLRNFDGMNFWRKGKRLRLKEGSTLICWGTEMPEIDGVKVLNGAMKHSKYEEAGIIAAAGIRTIQTYSSRDVASYDNMIRTGWIPRRNHHVGGDDILNRTQSPDFWSLKEDVVEEFRIHIFDGLSIKAGAKVLRDGWTLGTRAEDFNPARQIAHPWVRSFDAGWRIKYDDFQSKRAMKEAAIGAVKALNLDFGAVDIGKLTNDRYIVFEVNRAPGLSEGTLDQYVRAFRGEFRGKKKEKNDDSSREAGEQSGDISVSAGNESQPNRELGNGSERLVQLLPAEEITQAAAAGRSVVSGIDAWGREFERLQRYIRDARPARVASASNPLTPGRR